MSSAPITSVPTVTSVVPPSTVPTVIISTTVLPPPITTTPILPSSIPVTSTQVIILTSTDVFTTADRTTGIPFDPTTRRSTFVVTASGTASQTPTSTATSSSSGGIPQSIVIGLIIAAILVVLAGIGIYVFRKFGLSPSRAFKDRVRRNNTGDLSGLAPPPELKIMEIRSDNAVDNARYSRNQYADIEAEKYNYYNEQQAPYNDGIQDPYGYYNDQRYVDPYDTQYACYPDGYEVQYYEPESTVSGVIEESSNRKNPQIQ